ncbi:LexA family transcriptional regulator [Metasolibacillus meyeri]|uniref:LexA family transcriptional regulator n=1 Tax=Metasolibacillus meyeri TaxID=1071052 RepID=UPI000D313CD0|nr:XRE family transcriptional regulator [Metasolibacillus meyeri]
MRKSEITAQEQRKILANNLNRLLEQKNKKKIDVFNALEKYGVSETTVYSWFNGRKYPRIDKIQLLADYFGVLKSDITEDKNYEGNSILKEEMAPYVTTLNSIKIPHFGNIAAGALAVIEGIQTTEVDNIQIPSQLLGKHATADNLFSMTVDGESMNKIIQNGSIVVAKVLDKLEYKQGDIVVFEHDGEYSLKRFAPQDIDGFVLFKAESADNRFKDIVIPKNTELDLKIYGKVVFFTTILD